MPFALVLIGLVLLITAILNTYAQFGTQLQTDLLGSKGFIVWVVALGSVGALGYINNLRTFSHYFMALILISMILSNKGFFQNFQAALASGPKAPTAAATVPQTSVSPNASTATINSAITSNTSGATGAPATSAGQSKFNGWINYLLGTSTKSN